MNGLCKEGKLEEARENLDRMKLQVLKPDAGLESKIIKKLLVQYQQISRGCKLP